MIKTLFANLSIQKELGSQLSLKTNSLQMAHRKLLVSDQNQAHETIYTKTMFLIKLFMIF